ncbi:alpha/beta hydrolase [Cryptosporangium aurantiacum]|uniref:Acetyl esterase/lipase n=1 Tax=Cryptosporangium aurantiacum TaxID=134849 RepID=A0A1M7TWM7_9ACTN|nr:alpha/beta hydrolase [Cryptosporangium aurantiacum]SHN75105.1 Acetyl esterase/lipase [Cryptosporangium aurantiacum]
MTGVHSAAGARPLLPPAHEGPLPPAHVAADGVRTVNAIPYAGVPGYRPLELDLILPPEAVGPVPVVVFLHGGGWRVGSRSTVGPAYAGTRPTPFERLALAGIAVASVDYRLSAEATWPAPLHDVKAAVRWLRARGSEAGLDTTRIAAWGESAGGHLAALLGLTGNSAALEGEIGYTGPSSAVDAVVGWYTPSDLGAVATDLGADPDAPDSREAQLLGGPVTADPERTAEASPITYAGPGAPPFLLLHGTADRLISVRQSERFAALLPGATLELFDGADHMWRGAPEAAAAALDRTVTFLRAHLLPSGR